MSCHKRPGLLLSKFTENEDETEVYMSISSFLAQIADHTKNIPQIVAANKFCCESACTHRSTNPNRLLSSGINFALAESKWVEQGPGPGNR